MRFNPKIETDMSVLDKLILKGESSTLDFKRTITSKQKIARTLAAFANNKGGKLLIGVEDDGFVTGTDAEEEMYMLHEAAEHFCDPPVDVAFTIYDDEEQGLTVLEAEVQRSLKKPHLAPDENGDWQIYIRAHDKTMLATKNTLQYIESDDETPVDANELDSKEKAVLHYLEFHQSITAKILVRQVNISLQRANRILVKMMQSGLILQRKNEQGEHYVLR